MYNPYSLVNKCVLITGASSGIGKATAIECSKLGAKVVITGRNKERLNETFVNLEGEGHIQFTTDLSDAESVSELINVLPELNGIVHAAGMVKTLPFQFVNEKDIHDIFDVNFFAPVLLTQKLIKQKKAIKSSSIVFISSIDGPLVSHIGNSMYSASKGAVSAIVKNMAVDLATKKIRVNSVLPGMTETPLIHVEGITQEQLDKDKQLFPLKRYAQPEEIAWAIIYLLSDASAWVTGTNLTIDGGFTLL